MLGNISRMMRQDEPVLFTADLKGKSNSLPKSPAVRSTGNRTRHLLLKVLLWKYQTFFYKGKKCFGEKEKEHIATMRCSERRRRERLGPKSLWFADRVALIMDCRRLDYTKQKFACWWLDFPFSLRHTAGRQESWILHLTFRTTYTFYINWPLDKNRTTSESWD